MTEDPFKEMIPLVEDAINKWHNKNQPKGIVEYIHKKLDKSRDEVLLKLMGFNKDSWGGTWALDHCNNRSGNSIAGDYLKSVQQDAINDWLSKVALPKLTKTDSDRIAASFKAEYLSRLKRAVLAYAEKKADEHARQLVDALVPTPPIDQYVRLKTLITPTT